MHVDFVEPIASVPLCGFLVNPMIHIPQDLPQTPCLPRASSDNPGGGLDLPPPSNFPYSLGSVHTKNGQSLQMLNPG